MAQAQPLLGGGGGIRSEFGGRVVHAMCSKHIFPEGRNT